jgi:uncharacterized lipoprotein YmbA
VIVRTRSLAPLLLLAACVAPRLEAHYYDPHPSDVAGDPATATTRPVRLGHVTAAPYLRDRIVWRIADTELFFDEENRWAAPPERMVEEALRRDLDPRNGFPRSDAAGTATLDVHVAAFEVERGKGDVYVRLEATLASPDGSLRRGTCEARQVATVSDNRSIATAMGIALAEAIRRLGDWLRPSLNGS